MSLNRPWEYWNLITLKYHAKQKCHQTVTMTCLTWALQHGIFIKITGIEGSNAVGHKSGDSIVVITSRLMTMALMAKYPHHIETIFTVTWSTVPDTSYETKLDHLYNQRCAKQAPACKCIFQHSLIIWLFDDWAWVMCNVHGKLFLWFSGKFSLCFLALSVSVATQS